MKWLLQCFILPFFLLFATYSYAQNNFPKREFRGIWVATVLNLDYPSSKNLDSESQKQEWIALLNEYQKLGLNAVIFQIRPAGDAFYDSDLAPWSEYLTGKQGIAPQPYYDPLSFLIEETHKRGMEFHAWFNPYRATMNDKKDELSSKHMLIQKPEWLVEYDKKYYFNPALQEVRDHIVAVVKEVVDKYDIDGVHFDDYFYPYKKAGLEFPDEAQFQATGQEFSNIGDWRRHNVDMLIEELSKTIKASKPYVKFGISPFGVWRNESVDPVNGSATRAGVMSYDDLHADILKWLELSWIDYVAPQIYWNIGFAVADYKILVDWWSKHSFGKDLYIGHAAYKVASDSKAEWNDPSEISKQIALNRQNPNVQGSIYFRSKSVLDNPLGIADTLRNNQYKRPAMLPKPQYATSSPFSAPKLHRVKNKKEGVLIRWKASKKDKNNPPFYYIIYRFDKNGDLSFDNSKNILTLTPFGSYRKNWEFWDTTAEKGKQYIYVVRPVDRKHLEGIRSKGKRLKKNR
jgi:uncharacterized lipoprotein YddW (UPF0748 family)